MISTKEITEEINNLRASLRGILPKTIIFFSRQFLGNYTLNKGLN